MSFVDFLRSARQGPTPLLHEFKTNYDPQRRRVHGFVEGHEDLVFYRSAIEEIVGPKFRVYMYRCGNKKAVYETFRKLTLDGTTTGALFFADKDLSDILGGDLAHRRKHICDGSLFNRKLLRFQSDIRASLSGSYSPRRFHFRV
jgi:hypothetical protein